MADNVAVTAGTGTTIAADELVDATLGTVKVQYVKLMDGTLDGSTKATVGAGGLKVDPSGVTSPVSIATAPALVASTASIGKVNVQFNGTDPDLGSGTAGTKTLRTILDTASPGIIATGSQASPSASYLSTVAAGDIAAAASDSGNPVKIGGVGKTANPTAVTDGQRVNAIYDKLGKQVVVGSVRDLKGNQFTTITSSTAETTVVTAVASTFLDVYGCIVENTSATASKVTFKDSTAGTTQFELYIPAGDTRGFMLPESGAFKQTTVNTNWTATCGTSVASIVITMLFVKNI